jgi:hypothetical protein
MDVLLIHPPAAKPAEAPLGTAVLLAALRQTGIPAEAIDANLEAYLYLLDGERLGAAVGPAPSTSLRRALRHAAPSLELLRSPAAIRSFPRYATAVHHLNAALSACRGAEGTERLTLGDYGHGSLSPFSPADLERLGRGEGTTLFHGYFSDRVLPQVAAVQPKMVGLSVNYLHQVLPAFELAGLIRRSFPGIAIIGGGGMFGSWRETLRRLNLRFSVYDRVVFGPGEGPLAALAAGTAGEEYFLEGVAPFGFSPDFGFAPLARYLTPLPVLPVNASRGCYWRRCLFCPDDASPAQPFSASPSGAFPDLLLDLSQRYGARHFHLTDNAIPPATMAALAARGEDLHGLAWHGFVRFERALLDRKLVSGLARSGCRMLQLGLESGSQPVLDRLQKGTQLEVAGAILENLRQAGIGTYVYVMLGTPGETRDDAEQTLAFLEEHAEAIGFLNLSLMNLPRDSAMVDDARAFGIDSLAHPDEAEPLGLYRSFSAEGGWDRGAARRFLQGRLAGSPAIRRILARTPPLFTSNHAFFFPQG